MLPEDSRTNLPVQLQKKREGNPERGSSVFSMGQPKPGDEKMKEKLLDGRSHPPLAGWYGFERTDGRRQVPLKVKYDQARGGVLKGRTQKTRVEREEPKSKGK